jgi:dihydrolipoamide dehydrogenase
MTYDLVIIGSGPGGYVAAIRASQLGLKTAIIEKYSTLGGTCLNVGCIPSKALLDSSEHFHQATHQFKDHGIELSKIGLNMPQMIARKAEVVKQTCDGVAFLMKKNKIDVFQGIGSFEAPGKIKVSSTAGEEDKVLEAKHTIIATGSKPITPASFNYDKNRVITSTEALNISKLPKSMVIIGAGVIGLELGSVFARLGTEVEIIEFEERILNGMDQDCAKELQRSLKGLGIKFHLGHKVTSVKGSKTSASVSFEPKNGGETTTLVVDYCLIAIGRRPYTDGLGLDKAGINVDERGRIAVNDHLETNIPGIYAIGDVIRGAMLAHKASEEGIFLVERIAGHASHIDYNLIPGVVYTWPEVAAVGKTEEQLKTEGIAYKVGKFPFKALGRSRASGDTEGLVKIIAHKDSDEILGIHICGARAADLIASSVAQLTYRASAEDVAIMSHAHPTFAEAIKEAAYAAWQGKTLHT